MSLKDKTMGAIDEADNSARTEKVIRNQSDEQMDVLGRGTKRSHLDDSEPIVKRIKKNGFNSSAITPLALLNELRSGLNYKIVQSDGPPHSPNFLASVEVDGIVFNGCGNAKKIAKQRAAEAALLTLCPTILTITANAQESIDFTVDPSVASSNEKDGNAAIRQKMARLEYIVNQAMNGTMNAVMALNELLPGLKYECVQENSPKCYAPFVYAVTINKEVFKGSGNNKKSAKCAAARAVLLKKYEHLLNNSSVMMTHPFKSGTPPQPVANTFHAGAANQIAELVCSEYHRLMSGIPAEYIRRKVVAAIVMTTTADYSNGRVISFGTGTKCVSGEHICVLGSVLNDSHAEIITRRGLLRFLYQQLSLHATHGSAKESIFIYDTSQKCYRLKNDIKFHLYISTSPCGDARIFSPHDKDGGLDEALDRHPNRQSRGQLRTKIESGEGTIPVKSFDTIQTWDGVMQGERLLTMSCSDKLGKWNVVGVQGSLLSHFIEPIYLHSVVIGSLFHPTHLRRALFSRLQNTLEGLPPPFRLNKILMNTTTSPEARHTIKAPNHSVNWIAGESEIEIVNAVIGKTMNGNASRLCKQRLLGVFYGLLNRGIKTKSNITIHNVPEFYVDIKNAATDYQEAKSKMVTAFFKAGLGMWKKKPLEQDQFALNVALH